MTKLILTLFLLMPTLLFGQPIIRTKATTNGVTGTFTQGEIMSWDAVSGAWVDKDFTNDVNSLASANTDTALTNANIVWVRKDGSDATGVRGRYNKPYASITGGLAVAQSGDIVHVGPGTYTVALRYAVSNTVFTFTGKSNIVFEGEGPGTVVYGEGAGTFFRVATNCESIVFRNFTIQGNKPGGAALTNGIYAAIEWAGVNVKHIVIDSVQFRDLGDHGVCYAAYDILNQEKAADIIVKNCYFENGGNTSGVPSLIIDGAAIVIGSQRMGARNNTITNWARGIEFHSFLPVWGAYAIGNTISGIRGDNSIFVVPDAPGIFYDFIIENNEITSSFSTYDSAAFDQAGISILRGERGLVANNAIRGGTYGLRLQTGASQVKVKGNLISGQRHNGIFSQEDNFVSDCQYENNQISFVGSHGIRMGGSRNTVSGNTISECSTNGAGGAGINYNPFGAGGGTDNIFEGNRLYDRQASPTMTVGISLGPNATNCVLVNNYYGVGLTTKSLFNASATGREEVMNVTGKGIGTNDPSASLHVDGNLNLAGRLVNFDPRFTKLILAGDSLTSSGTSWWWALTNMYPEFSRFETVMVASNGVTTWSLLERWNTVATNFLNLGSTQAIVFATLGANGGTTNPAVWAMEYSNIVARVHASNGLFFGFTIFPRSDDAGFDLWVNETNKWVNNRYIQTFSGADFVADVSPLARNAFDTAMFSDGVHPTALLSSNMAHEVRAAFYQGRRSGAERISQPPVVRHNTNTFLYDDKGNLVLRIDNAGQFMGIAAISNSLRTDGLVTILGKVRITGTSTQLGTIYIPEFYLMSGTTVRAQALADADGSVMWRNGTASGWTGHKFGGATATFPMLGRSGAGVYFHGGDGAASVSNNVSIPGTNFVGLLQTTNGLSSFRTNVLTATGATGWTNTFGVNAFAIIDGTGVTYVLYNNGGTAIYTNQSLVANATIPLQPNGKFIITAGTAITGVAFPQ